MPDSEREVSIGQLVEQLLALGVEPGGTLLVHTSFRAVRPVEGGPLGLIEAMTRALGPAGTLVMPSWSHRTGLFHPATSPVDPDLGIVAQLFWQQPGVQRARHAHAFAARGPRSDRILGDPLPLPPHIPASPVGRVRELDGQVLLLGVNHDADTTIHLAEVLAEVPYGIRYRCWTMVDGEPQQIEYLENDHCCARFTLVDGWLDESGRQARGTVGHAEARLIRSRDIVATVVPRLREDPLLFLHDRSVGCAECDEARESVAA